MATIKTRILLPTKTAAEWESSDRVLSAGELALVTDDNGGFKLIAGDGKTYGEGVRELEAGSTTAHYEVTDLAQLSGVYNNGDTAVVKKILAEGKDPSYTAYVYDGALSAWKAMDGNYSSDNVYFEEDIVKAGSWAGVGNISHTPNKVETLTTAGLSLTEVMDKIFKGNEAYPTKPTPSCGITQTAKSVEVGTTVTPAFTLSFDEKKYAYGSNTKTALNSTTGVTAATYILTYTDKDNITKTLTGNWTTSVTASESYNVKAGDNNGTAYLSVVYNAAADGTYIPRSNLERVLSSATELTKYRVAGGTATANNANNKIVGYYPNFYGFRDQAGSFNPDAITAEDLAKLTKYSTRPNSKTGLCTPQTSLTASGKWRQVFYIMPTALGYASAEAVNSNGLPVTIKKASSSITVTHQNNVTSTYDVFYSQQEADAGATTLTITWKK